MKNIFRPLLLIILFLTVFFAAACSENTENEHLPEYCQTYAGFTSIASKDFYDLLREQSDIDVNRLEYIEAISQISLEFSVDDPNREIDLSGIQCFQNLTDLTLVGRSFKDLSPISALSNIQSIELNGTSVVSIDSFKNLSKIKSLVISDTRTLQSVAGVEEMTKLTDLDLSNNGIVVIDGLNNLVNLETLYLNDNEIISFPSINQLEELVILDISDNNINQLGEDLSGLSKLTTLNAQNNEICDLSTLDDLISLVTLNLSNNDLGCGGVGVSPNFDSLENAPNLENLYLDNNNLTSIEGLRGRDINLEVLHINDNNLTDITPIGEYTGIMDLVLFNNNITDIDDLSGMIGLTTIDLSNNSINDFSDLLGIPNLVDVNLSFNNITTIPDISTSWSSLSTLDLSSNILTDTSGVEGHPTIESLIIYNNGLHELNGISNLPELENLEVFNEVLESELDPIDVNPNEIRIIRNSFINLESLVLQVENEFNFGFELADSIEIYNSINGLTDIDTIIFTDMDIDIIDEYSINLPNLRVLYVDENNISDISFILGNPLLERLYINDNTIDNLEVISGVDTTDFDNLEHIVASNITADNNLVNSFIQLPNVSTIDLTNTSIVSISNSFNDLSSLTLINFDADNLLKIEDSFNNIFATYESTNSFIFNSGMIGVISNSFNDGIYETIGIINQVTTETTTIIEDSFNNIEVRNTQGIVIENSNFSTIDNSFNSINTDELSVASNTIETITDSFIDSTFNNTLDLSNNLLETVPSLNQVTTVDRINLNNNILNTLVFLDSIPNITTLDLSVQRNETTLAYTLAGIDGINNMPTLTTLLLSDIGVTAIDGLRNTGLTSFEFSYSDNNEKYISIITATSFTGTPLTTLDLEAYQLADITFIDNLDVLESLYIGIDLADLSDFQGQDFETTLEVMVIENLQNIADFNYLSDYDTVTNLTFRSPLTTTINNLDGMDSLFTLFLEVDLITDITDSFNELPDFTPNRDYIGYYSNLNTITNSFDIYGDTNHPDTVDISSSITVTDSFNNLLTLNIEGNDGDLVPKFDTLSFDNISNIVFESGSYSSLTFLNGYVNLTDITFEELNVAITDLANDSITTLHVLSADVSINALTLDLNSSAVLDLTSLRNGQITIDGDFVTYDINAINADVILNSSALLQSITANVGDLTLNANSVISVELNNYTTDNTIFNTNSLTGINRLTTSETNALIFTINSLETTLDFSIKSNELIINDNNATGYTLNAVGGTVTVNNTQTDIDIDINASELQISYNSLEDVTLNGTVGTVNINSTTVDTITTAASTITTLYIDSNEAVMSISGSGITTVDVTNNAINDITAIVGNADLSITSTNSELLNATINADTVTLNANSVPSIVLTDTSTIGTLDATNNVSLSTLTYGIATISNIEVTTSETSLSISGSTSIMILSGTTLTNLTIDSPLSSVEILDISTTLSINVDIGAITFDNTTLTTLNMDTLSELSLLRIINSSVFSTLNSNDSSIANLAVFTDVPILNIDAINSLSNDIEGSLFTSVTVDFGINDVSISSTSALDLDMEIIASNLILETDTTDLTIDNDSTLASLNLNGATLADINSGTASISALEIINSNSDLDVIGSGIDAISITSNIGILDVYASLTTTLDINSSRIAGTDITTNTSHMNVTALGDVEIISNTLENIIFDVGINDIVFTLNKANLDFTLDGLAGKATINGGDVDSIITNNNNTILGTLVLNNLDVDVLDFTIGVIDNLEIVTLLTSLNITGDEVKSIIITGSNLTTLDVTSNTGASELTLTTAQTTLDLNGNIDIISITNNNLTLLDVADVTAVALTVQANSLETLDTSTNVSDIIDITTTQSTFDLITSATNIDFIGSTLGTLDLTNTNTSLTILNTNTNRLDVASSSSSLSIDGSNLNEINGTIDSASISNTTGTLTLGISATGTLEINNNTVTSIIFSGVNTIDELDIKSTTATTIDTNSVDITTLKYEANTNDTVITTESDLIELSTSGNAEITLNYDGATLLNLQANVSNSVIVNLITASSLDVEGVVASITITGVNINTVATDSLIVNTTFTMNDTLLDDLDFISNDVMTNVDTIEVNTLSNSNINTIMTRIDNSEIDLISPIVDLDVYNYYYDSQETTLTNQEVIDTLRYDGFRDDVVNAAWAKIITNEYMDHLDEATTKTEIDSQIYQTAESYFINYRDDAGLIEDDFTVIERADIVNTIQATIDDPLLTISEIDLNAQVTASIDTDAATYATTEQLSDTFTLS